MSWYNFHYFYFCLFHSSRKQELDSSQPPKQPGKPPDPGRPVQPGLSKSRTTDTLRSEQKLPGRSPSTISLKESKSRTDFKDEHKSSMMPGFLSEESSCPGHSPRGPHCWTCPDGLPSLEAPVLERQGQSFTVAWATQAW